MKQCPKCGKEVEELRGVCECGEDLTVHGIQEGIEATNAEAIAAREDLAAERTAREAVEARLTYLEEQIRDRPMDGGGDREDQPKPVSMSKLIRALITGDWKDAKYEESIVHGEEANHLRVLGMGAIGTGGAIVPTLYLPQEFIEALRARLVVEQLGARVLDGLTGSPVDIPRLAAGATAYWVGEGDPKTPADQTFEKLQLTPHEVSGLTQISNRLVMLSNPAADRMVSQDLSKIIALAVDLAAMLGTGAGAQPTGIVNTGGVGTYTLIADVGNGGIPARGDVDGIVYTLEAANADMGKIGWAMHPRTANTFRAMPDASGGAGTGGFLFRDEIIKGELGGFQLKKTTQIPINLVKGAGTTCSRIIFANWDDLIVAYWGGLELAVSTQAGTAFQYNQTWVRASLLCDIGLRHPTSFVSVDGVLP